MVEDVVRALGFLCLGTRMKRIGERLQSDTQHILDTLDVPLQSSHYPFLAALDRIGPSTIGDLAGAIGITQPGATRTLGQLAKMGLVEARQPREDQRRRIVSLTAKGQHMVDDAKRDVWPRIEAAVVDLCAGLSGPLLTQLASVEDGLDASPLHRRAAKREAQK